MFGHWLPPNDRYLAGYILNRVNDLVQTKGPRGKVIVLIYVWFQCFNFGFFLGNHVTVSNFMNDVTFLQNVCLIFIFQSLCI